MLRRSLTTRLDTKSLFSNLCNIFTSSVFHHSIHPSTPRIICMKLEVCLMYLYAFTATIYTMLFLACPFFDSFVAIFCGTLPPKQTSKQTGKKNILNIFSCLFLSFAKRTVRNLLRDIHHVTIPFTFYSMCLHCFHILRIACDTIQYDTHSA